MAKQGPKQYVYGFHAVTALIRQSSNDILNLYIDKNKNNARTLKLVRLIEDHNLDYEYTDRNLFERLLGNVVHQGIVAKVESSMHRVFSDLNVLFSNTKPDETILILDGIQDPANLGGCLRTADAAGVKHVILPKDKSCPVTAVTRKVAAGAVESLNIYTITNLARTIQSVKQHGFWIIGMSEQSQRALYQYNFNGKIAVVMGNEGKGLRRLTQKACDQLLEIPMQGRVESLNVSMATAITLFEIYRQRMHSIST